MKLIKCHHVNNIFLTFSILIGGLLNTSSIYALDKCTTEVSVQRNYITNKAISFSNLYDGLPRKYKVTSKTSDTAKKSIARKLYLDFKKLNLKNGPFSYKNLCLEPVGTKKSYIDRLSLQAIGYNKKLEKLARRIDQGVHPERNNRKYEQVSTCKSDIIEELIPLTKDVCEGARINIELEKIAIKKSICTELNTKHIICAK